MKRMLKTGTDEENKAYNWLKDVVENNKVNLYELESVAQTLIQIMEYVNKWRRMSRYNDMISKSALIADLKERRVSVEDSKTKRMYTAEDMSKIIKELMEVIDNQPIIFDLDDVVNNIRKCADHYAFMAQSPEIMDDLVRVGLHEVHDAYSNAITIISGGRFS